MKAVVYRENGGPEVLSYEDVPDPTVGEGQVLVRLEAISIEGGDLLSRQMMPLPRVPFCVGYGAAGVIAAIGEGVTGLSVGQRVAAYGHDGSHAEYRVSTQEHVWPLPDGIDMKAAACVPIAFGTAYEALFELGKLEASQDVLIHGASGGVSLAAIQLAKKAGARVIGTGSNDEQLEKIRQYGLDDTVNHRTEDLTARVLELTQGKGVALSVDPLGGSMTQSVIAATANGGRIILLGGSSREPTMINATSLVLGNHVMAGFMLSASYHLPRVRAYIANLFERIAQGDLDVVIDRTFPLSEAVEAHRYAETRCRIGRVVMVP